MGYLLRIMKQEINQLTEIINNFNGKELTPAQKKILLTLTNIRKAMERQDNYIIEMEHEVERICRDNVNRVVEVEELRSRLVRIKLERK